jgi:hypothetical protein
VNRSGSIANGPRPKALKPNIHCSKGLDESAYSNRISENRINPIVNSDRIFLNISTYVASKKTSSVALIEESTVLTL